MQKTIEVVDNFYRHPLAVRESALKDNVWRDANDNDRAMYDTRTDLYDASEEAKLQITKVFSQPFLAKYGSSIQGFFTFIGKGSSTRIMPRIYDVEWAAFIFLSLPEQCSGGIAFYRPTTLDISESFVDVLGDQAWEETTYIPMRFNRLVLFRASSLYHRTIGEFGQTPETGQLSQLFLFNGFSGLETA